VENVRNIRAQAVREPPPIDGRVPPHDLDAEAAVLSAVMLDGSALDRVLEFLRPEHFYSEAHRRIFEACLELRAKGQPVDMVQVATWLKDRERIQQIGGLEYLASILNVAPAVANVAAYARTIHEKWRVRQVILTCQRVAAQGYIDYGEAQQFIDEAEQSIYTIARTQESSSVERLLEVIKKSFKKLTEALERGDRITGIATGFERLDRLTAGLHEGDLTVVAARPGMGKTSFVLNVATNVAASKPTQRAGADGKKWDEPGVGVVIFSLEMPREQIANRMVCSEGRVDVSKVRSGYLGAPDWNKLTQASAYLGSLPIWIDDSPGLSILELRAKVRRLQAEYDRVDEQGRKTRRIGLVIVDYLQLMRGRENASSREQEISEISRGLKGLAKELGVAVIALSQLNRAVETRSEKSKRPQLSDLRECVTGDTLVRLADGREVPIRMLVGQSPEVLSMDEQGRIVAARSDLVWSVGRRRVLRITLSNGQSIRATPEHRLFGARGWVRAGKLTRGWRLATVAHARMRMASGMSGISEPAVVWERVVAIEEAGHEEVFDLTVPATSSWIASGIVSHNSGAIEQDADNIIFIYRDEYYNKETTTEKNIAELIVAKQRNGPTGTVKVRFDREYTRFDNLADGEYPDDDEMG
jgi:replicative DNA helicase